MELLVLFHNNCFDGAASAAVFARFYRERIRQDARIRFLGLAHQAGGAPIDPAVFTGDENVIVDFRYSQDARLTWWFDHHRSAFQQDGDESHFRADSSGKKFHDPARKSCTKYLADIAAERFGFDPSPLRELIDWAELIDGAQFPSPKVAVELAEPALQLMTVLEATKDASLIEWVIESFQSRSLSEVARDARVQEPFRLLFAKHHQAIETVRRKARYEDGIVFFDVADEGLDAINKFISYYLYPDARYTVWVGASAARAKVSIGSNPWRQELRRHDLAHIAEGYGGGGHPVVAAMSYRPDEVAKARATAAAILKTLKSG
ncbi:MAG: hypothetical protein ACKVPX_06300 [Myxococcaceae bacterium]